jgi:4-amino-4-deoxy-L-arabinose transferase-like glycosyltransferase
LESRATHVREEKVSGRAALLAFVALAIVWFSNIGERKLVRPDEGRYAEIAREMVSSGDWVTPRLNGFKYFEKPPLQYWATALAFTAFGNSEWTARLWPALTGFLAILLVWYFAHRAIGPPAGWYAAAVLASSFLFTFIAHVVTLDMGLTLLLSSSVLSLAMAQRDSTGARETRNWMLAAWVFAALAVLSKGLIGIVLPAGALALYILVERDWRLLGRLHSVAGLFLFLLVAAPWFIAVSLANREFFDFFFIHEHFERFLTKVHGRYQPAWYFAPVLLAGALPWTLTLIPALWQAWKKKPSLTFQTDRFLLVWCAVVFVFFSVSDSKLASYILPVFPALAVLLARYFARIGRNVAVAQAILAAVLGVAAAWYAPRIVHFGDAGLPAALLERYAPWLQASGIALGAAALAATWLMWRARMFAGTALLAFGALTFTQLAISGYGELSPVYSAYHIVERVRPYLRADAPFYSVNTFDHTLPYYLGRTVTMVAYKDELERPISWEPQNFIPDLAGFVRKWQSDQEAFAMFSAADFNQFGKTLGIPMRILASDPRRVIVGKP